MIFPEWESKALAQIKAWAMDHYETGGDVIVEAFTDAEIHEDFIAKAADPTEAVNLARAFCELRYEYAEDIRASAW